MTKYKIIIILILFSIKVVSQENKQISKTIITPYLETKISNDSNIVYCSTFQIAWNEFKEVVGGNIILNDKIPMVELLNVGINAKENINKQSYFVTSGRATNEYINSVNRELKKKFKDVFEPIDDKASLATYLFYSFLFKHLKFNKNFESFENGISFKSNSTIKKVKAFGIKFFEIGKKDKKEKNSKKLLKQIDAFILPDKYNQFIVRLKLKNKNEEIILAKITPSREIKETISNVLELSKKLQSSENYNICELAIPEIDMDFDKNYNELIEKTILNEKLHGYIIKEAKQSVIFKLDEQGAILKSKAKIKATYGSKRFDDTQIFQRLIFDAPFLLILKEKNKELPYFAIWISNEEIMKDLKK
jgi:hypothetical protein